MMKVCNIHQQWILKFCLTYTVANSSPEMKKKHDVIEEYLLLLRSWEELKLIEVEVFILQRKLWLRQRYSLIQIPQHIQLGLMQLLEEVTQLQLSLEKTTRAMKDCNVADEDIAYSSSESDSDFWIIIIVLSLPLSFNL